jgi:hypothetical protein
MDIPVRYAYLRVMFQRVVIMLAVLAIAVVTTMTSAHAARMAVGQDHAGHAGAMMQAPDAVAPDCGGQPDCGATDAGLCKSVCTGLSAVLAAPGDGAGHAHQPAGHGLPAAAVHAGRAPDLADRPPMLRLL